VTRYPLLSAAQLNRAVLARQRLLERSADPLVAVVEQVGGLQAQEPASPYIALWSRIAAFEASRLDEAFQERRVIKATLVRATLHAVSRDDYLHLLPAVRPMLHRLTRRERGGNRDPDLLDRLAAAATAFADRPRSNTELRAHIAGLADGLDPDDALWWVRRLVAFAHVPSDVPWSFGRRPSLVAAAAWLGGDAFEDEGPALERLVRRYLAAFGPATAADVAAWSGLPVARFRPAIEVIEAAGDLRHFSDERGRDLLDLAGAPLPDADTPAPVRLLPMWDSLVLAYADRTRVISDDHRRTVIGSNGDTLPTFLVDGRVAGLWWAEPVGERGGRTSRIVLEPFGRLRAADRRALEAEGERLAAFIGPIEPGVFGRYRRSRARRSSG
jgi:hypothetical protein